MTAPMRQAVIYARWSPQKQEIMDAKAENNQAVNLQIAQCREYCRKHGFVVIGTFYDEGRSGADPDRPGLIDARELCLEEDAWLIATREDRIFRDARLMAFLSYELKDRIEVVYDGFPGLTGPTGEMFRGMMRLLAEYERQTTSARTAHAYHARVGSGIHTGRDQFGFTLGENGRFARHPEQYPVLLRVIEGIRQGRPLLAIAKEEHMHRNTIRRIKDRMEKKQIPVVQGVDLNAV